MRLMGLGGVAIGLAGGFVLDYPDNAIMLLGFGAAGLCMLARVFASDKIAGAILLGVSIAGAAVIYGDGSDLIGAIIWLVGYAAGGVYLMWFARPVTSP
jgi:hypothetical protein